MPDDLRIGLCVSALSPQLTGIGRYCWELSTRLPMLLGPDNVQFYRNGSRIAEPHHFVTPVDAAGPGSKFARFRIGASRHAKVFARLGRGQRSSHFHGPNYMLPDWVEGGIVTVHDLSVVKHPETHPVERIRAFEDRFEKSLARSAHIITDCETVRREVIAFAGCDPSRVTAIPLGVDPRFRQISEVERNPVLARYGLPQTGYGLTISALEPRKRIDRLLRAWQELPSSLRNKTPLVVAGADGWCNADLKAQIADAVREGWVIQLGFVDERDLPAIYSGARLFVYPSLYEGFGLPPLEAMASGTPVVAANASCLPEVTKGAALLVEPDDINGFSLALGYALEDEAWRRTAISSGVNVAASYRWDICVERTVTLYRHVFDGNSSHYV